MERLFVGVENEINRSSTTTNKKSEKANHEFLHFSLFSLTLQSYTIKTAFLPFYCIISPHPRKLGTNRAVGTSRCRYRAYRRHRYGVREGLLLIQVVFTQKGTDEAKRNRRWSRWLLPTKEKPLSYVGWAQDKGFIWKGGLEVFPLQ